MHRFTFFFALVMGIYGCAGAEIDNEGAGALAVEANTCGGLAGAACPDGQFCDIAPADMCGAADQQGVCKPIPEACNKIFAPVCGCDGITYSNDCDRQGAGVSLLHEGECATAESIVCGGLAGAACPDGQFCDIAPADMCGAADQQGVCQPIPDVCLEIYSPVCGCDGKTYGNDCERQKAGVSLLQEGECP